MSLAPWRTSLTSLPIRKENGEPKNKNNFHQISKNIFLQISKNILNKRGGWNKGGGGAKVAKSLKVEVGINMEGGIFWKKLVHKCNKRGVEGGKNLKNQ